MLWRSAPSPASWPDKRLDLFGVVVLALVTALRGGTFRDLVLGISPIFWIKDPYFVHTAVAAALATFVIARFCELPQTVLLVADAFGLALFTIIGTEKSLTAGAPDTIAIFLGVVTGVGGGMIRDALSGEIPLVFRKEIYLYATAAFAGAALLVALGRFFPGQPYRRLIAAGAILLLRLAGIRWRITLPLFRSKPATKESDTNFPSRNSREVGSENNSPARAKK